MARLVDQMIGQGLLTRQVYAGDGRAHELYITEKGAALAKQVRKIATEQSRVFFSDVSEEDQKYLLEILKKVYRRTVGFRE